VDRYETVLYWDDGTSDVYMPVVLAPHQEAVSFTAPEDATWLTAVLFYICNDQVVDPEHPELPTTAVFTACVWAPDPGGEEFPGEVVNSFVSGAQYPEDSWLRLDLPSSVDLSDPAVFPGRAFFVGLDWITTYNPIVGFDTGTPAHGASWCAYGDVWERHEETDVMIRAVVSNEPQTPVEVGSWGQIKAIFR
jgi:hypothetical protein